MIDRRAAILVTTCRHFFHVTLINPLISLSHFGGGALVTFASVSCVVTQRFWSHKASGYRGFASWAIDPWPLRAAGLIVN